MLFAPNSIFRDLKSVIFEIDSQNTPVTILK